MDYGDKRRGCAQDLATRVFAQFFPTLDKLLNLAMTLIDHLQEVTLDSFLIEHPELNQIRDQHAAQLPGKIDRPMLVLAAESAYNERAMSYVCALGGIIGESSPYRYRFLCQSQVMAAFSVEEGGFEKRGFLDPHSALRMFMLETAKDMLGQDIPEAPFARRGAEGMGRAYLWREGSPEVADRFAAMLGAHFASEYLAASSEFPGITNLFDRDQPQLMAALREAKESHFGYSAAAWLEGHQRVELKHAAFAGRAAVAASWELADSAAFWESYKIGFGEFCRNDAEYFAALASALAT